MSTGLLNRRWHPYTFQRMCRRRSNNRHPEETGHNGPEHDVLIEDERGAYITPRSLSSEASYCCSCFNVRAGVATRIVANIGTCVGILLRLHYTVGLSGVLDFPRYSTSSSEILHWEGMLTGS